MDNKHLDIVVGGLYSKKLDGIKDIFGTVKDMKSGLSKRLRV
jgi:hypothetical protein